ncbi:MAG: hypothetical protein IJ360_01305 [Clostridia bacterium]|nr:hypothetical protein [Clostridia bacterium]
MNFRRIISLVLVFVMLTLTLASCDLQQIIGSILGSTTTTTTPTTTTPTTTQKPDPKPDPTWDELYEIITIAEALEIAKEAGFDGTADRYYIRGKIDTISNVSYGEMTISDETGSIYVYGTYSYDGELRFPEIDETPVKGDEVLLHCVLSTYNDEPQVKNARLIDFKPADKEDIDASKYTEMTIAEAREADLGALVKVTGVVARITYANGMKPAGIYLVDGTNSIYVYDGDIAGQVKIGNRITVLGSKDMWILDTETNNAQKFGYEGCCQISDATLYENDKAENEIDFTWCEEKSVKDILETPVTENVTTTIYKTTALVKKVPGSGFTNYYFFDLDGETGAYTYTQCNGNDFAWLDEFDGKLCTVYLSPMNAKSTSSDCYFRFLPVAVYDEGFVFDVAKAPQHVVEYYGVGQFLSEYTGNPLLELVTNVSSELLGFENATLSYSSSDENVVYFEEADGKLIFNCKNNGTATVTITGTYGEYTHSVTVEITVDAPVTSEGLTVEEAIGTAVGEVIKVEGIVGPSLVNRDGFYLIDETGVLAIIVNDATVWEGLAIGQKVVIEGKRDLFHNGTGTHAGQVAITGATVVVNYYGQHEYSTESFITNKTLDDFYALDASVNHSNEVYVVVGTIVVEETAYYTNMKLMSPGGQKITLYSSSASQYNWLKAFAGQEITIEIAPCNWNNKTFWAGCVIAVRTADGKVCNVLNFTSN